MKKFKKNWIKMNEDKTEEVKSEVEEKEEEKMNFFQKHKKGLIFGGLGALAAGVAGILIANKGSDDVDDEDIDLDDEIEDEDIASEMESEEA